MIDFNETFIRYWSPQRIQGDFLNILIDNLRKELKRKEKKEEN